MPGRACAPLKFTAVFPRERLEKENVMAKVSLNKPAPDFALKNFAGDTVHLSAFRGQKNVLLVFNRGFY